jgi:O-acetyl-ADP-ribose deacetylase (regulator of RNase III)
MIKIVLDDILNCKEFVIVHQVNTLGIMGGGLALLIKNRYPSTYQRYKEICEKYPSDYLMGKMLLTVESKDDKKDAKVISMPGIPKS